MNREQTIKAIKVMQHFADEGKVQNRVQRLDLPWVDNDDPSWDWTCVEYRIPPEKKKLYGIYSSEGNLLMVTRKLNRAVDYLNSPESLTASCELVVFEEK